MGATCICQAASLPADILTHQNYSIQPGSCTGRAQHRVAFSTPSSADPGHTPSQMPPCRTRAAGGARSANEMNKDESSAGQPMFPQPQRKAASADRWQRSMPKAACFLCVPRPVTAARLPAHHFMAVDGDERCFKRAAGVKAGHLSRAVQRPASQAVEHSLQAAQAVDRVSRHSHDAAMEMGKVMSKAMRLLSMQSSALSSQSCMATTAWR